MDYNLKKSYPIQILKKNHSKIASDMHLSDYEKSERPLSPRLFSFLDYDDYEQSESTLSHKLFSDNCEQSEIPLKPDDYEQSEIPLKPDDYEQSEIPLSPNDCEKYERPLSPNDCEKYERPLSPRLFSFLDYDDYEQSEIPLGHKLFSDNYNYEKPERPLNSKFFSANYENDFNVPQNIKSLSLIQIFFYSYTHPTILFPPDISRDSYFKKYKGLYQRNDKFFERELCS